MSLKSVCDNKKSNKEHLRKKTEKKRKTLLRVRETANQKTFGQR